MGANQILNMVMKIMMRKAISKGVDMGFNAVSKPKGRGQQAQMQHPDELDYDAPPQKKQLTPEQRKGKQEARRARRAARQARQAMKVTGRVTRM